MASGDHRCEQSFPREDTSHTYKAEKVNIYVKKNPRWVQEPTGKRASFIGKGNERCQRVTWRITPKENRWKGRDVSMEIDQVDHGEI
jgi:hypothetical protein